MRAQKNGLHGARRILLYGVTGSGKSTLAARLSELTGIAWTEVDGVTWLPGWVQLPVQEQRRRLTELCAADSWLLDSAYGTWVDVPLARADLVVGLDFGRWLTLGRLLRRTAARNFDRREVCNGNVESWRQTFSRESIILWHFRSFRRKHDRLVQWEDDPDRPPVLRLRTPEELEAWLVSVAAELRQEVR
jgi:adenylate kinase family enzyme